jgi:hypothetical protein
MALVHQDRTELTLGRRGVIVTEQQMRRMSAENRLYAEPPPAEAVRRRWRRRKWRAVFMCVVARRSVEGKFGPDTALQAPQYAAPSGTVLHAPSPASVGSSRGAECRAIVENQRGTAPSPEADALWHSTAQW